MGAALSCVNGCFDLGGNLFVLLLESVKNLQFVCDIGIRINDFVQAIPSALEAFQK